MTLPAGSDNYCPGSCQGSCSCSSSRCGSSYGYTPRQCTGFCAFRINQTLGVSFGAGRPLGAGWGNANTWHSRAAAQGIAVNTTPAVGSICNLPNISKDGHVAFVLAIVGGGVLVEDYNWDFTCSYHQHVIPLASSGSGLTLFIHVKDQGSTCTTATCKAPCACNGNTCSCPTPQPPPPVSMSEVGVLALIGIGAGLVYVGRHPQLRARLLQGGGGGFDESGVPKRARMTPQRGTISWLTQRSGGYAEEGLGRPASKAVGNRGRVALSPPPAGYNRRAPRGRDPWDNRAR